LLLDFYHSISSQRQLDKGTDAQARQIKKYVHNVPGLNISVFLAKQCLV
jgi:hypothetical protein